MHCKNMIKNLIKLELGLYLGQEKVRWITKINNNFHPEGQVTRQEMLSSFIQVLESLIFMAALWTIKASELC